MKKFDFLETEYHLEKKYLGFTGKGSFTYSGKIKSFSTVVKVNPDWKDCFITIQAQKDNEEIALIDLLKRNEVLKETNITINDNSSFTISYTIPSFSSSNKKRFDEIIETTISILKKNFYNPNVILTEEKEEEFSNFKYKEKFNECLDEMKLHKLMYFLQRENIILNDTELFEEEFKGWKYGPILKSVRTLYRNGKIKESKDINFDKPLKDLINDILRKYGLKSSWSLSRITHEEASWKNSRIGLDKEENGDKSISLDDIRIDAKRIKERRIEKEKLGIKEV